MYINVNSPNQNIALAIRKYQVLASQINNESSNLEIEINLDLKLADLGVIKAAVEIELRKIEFHMRRGH